ncbi:uncharacterized protein ACJ7VT_011135 isoform 1-T2 [Polymixia lowei]
MLCRLLTANHFIENAERPQATDADGNLCFKIRYPKWMRSTLCRCFKERDSHEGHRSSTSSQSGEEMVTRWTSVVNHVQDEEHERYVLQSCSSALS